MYIYLKINFTVQKLKKGNTRNTQIQYQADKKSSTNPGTCQHPAYIMIYPSIDMAVS